ncbi:MAG: hypothetical protein IJN25_05475 [Clostridia bacterium]|nr:hypothetical protein [Oscillospiraceae bacterium]MBQ7033092.1 hypothetical protein [Clostridia bacterium]
MFSHIGKKIKVLAWCIFVLIVIAGVVLGAILSNEENEILPFFILSFCGVILGWFNSFLLYSYGELVDCNQKQVQQNAQMIALLSKAAPSPAGAENATQAASTVWFCTACGTRHTDSSLSQCLQCGETRGV